MGNLKNTEGIFSFCHMEAVKKVKYAGKILYHDGSPKPSLHLPRCVSILNFPISEPISSTNQYLNLYSETYKSI